MRATCNWLCYCLLLGLAIGGCAAETSPNATKDEVALHTASSANSVDEPVAPTAVPTLESSRSSGVITVTAVADSLEPVQTTLTAPVAPEENTPMPNTPSSPTTSSPAVQQWIAQAKDDLAIRLSVLIESIELMEFRAVIWPDGSLGCPEPGMIYTQVSREGFLIRLKSGESEYQYHGSGTRPPFLCQNPSDKGEIGQTPPGLGND